MLLLLKEQKEFSPIGPPTVPQWRGKCSGILSPETSPFPTTPLISLGRWGAISVPWEQGGFLDWVAHCECVTFSSSGCLFLVRLGFSILKPSVSELLHILHLHNFRSTVLLCLNIDFLNYVAQFKMPWKSQMMFRIFYKGKTDAERLGLIWIKIDFNKKIHLFIMIYIRQFFV